MKNLRKLFTLALALMMLVSVFTLPALAATVEHDHGHACETTSEIQPRVVYLRCIYCNGSAKKVGTGTNYEIFECQNCGKKFYVY